MFSLRVLKNFSSTRKLSRSENQASQLGKYAIDFLNSGNPSQKVLERCRQFHTDSVFTGISALALKTNAPTVLRQEALDSSIAEPKAGFAKVFGSERYVPFEKAILANASAVREWDSNGTVFGYNKGIAGHQAGEFGHNDFYPVVVAAAQ